MAKTSVHSPIRKLTDRIRQRSRQTREAYLASIERAARSKPVRAGLSCTNFAHGFAAFEPHDKLVLRQARKPNIAIVSAYNDMLSAHQPFERFPQIINKAASEAGGEGKIAGRTPATVDGGSTGDTMHHG